MKLFLFRHGMADFENGKEKVEDPGLNAAGRSQVENVCKMAIEMGIKPSKAFTSPLKRAVETAEFCRKSGLTQGEAFVSPKLHPDADPDELLEAVMQGGDEDSVLLVSHYPIIGKLAKKLLSKDLGFYVRNGGILGIEIHSDRDREPEVSIYLT